MNTPTDGAPSQPLSKRAAALAGLVAEELGGELDLATKLALARYARALDAAWRCWEAFEAASEVTGTTDRGGDRVNPALEAALKAERAAVQFGRAVGFELEVKRLPGGQRGVPRAPDRAAGVIPMRRKAAP